MYILARINSMDSWYLLNRLGHSYAARQEIVKSTLD
jgi:hypothetical protein